VPLAVLHQLTASKGGIGEMIESVRLNGIGPVHDLTASFGERLNIITGDNGLGKSFLLDVCFWALTGSWPGGRIAIPDGSHKSPSIKYDVKGKTKATTTTPSQAASSSVEPSILEASYDFKSQAWNRKRGRPRMPGLVIYAAVDGSFSVWDPARNYWREPRAPNGGDDWPRAFQFPTESSTAYSPPGTEAATIRRDVANGLEEGGRVLCNGLIADWGEWFYRRSANSEVNPFQAMEDIVALLSHPLEPLQCEEPRKVFLDDSRKFPTLRMPSGVVPYPHWSAGVKRIVSFAYLIVWAWVEHKQAAELRHENPTNRIVLIADEIEAHLHPKWQRTILPAILQVVGKLHENLMVQVLATTHSPLVLASIEPYFEEDKDELFCFSLNNDNTDENNVTFDNLPWVAHGDAVGWLTSDIFGLDQARSREAEEAIEAAEAFLRGDGAALPVGLSNKEEITEHLRKLLPGLDPFWPRWIVQARP